MVLQILPLDILSNTNWSVVKRICKQNVPTSVGLIYEDYLRGSNLIIRADKSERFEALEEALQALLLA